MVVLEVVRAQRTPQWSVVIVDQGSIIMAVTGMVDVAAAIREVEIHLKLDHVIIRARVEDLREVFNRHLE